MRLKTFIAGLIMTACLLPAISTQAQVFAPAKQYRTWSVGIHGGLLSQANIFELGREFEGLQYHAGYGAFIKKQILPAFALKAEFLGGKVAGSMGEDQFETKLKWSGALLAEFNFMNINWRHRQGIVRPYLQTGMGMMRYQPWLYEEGEEFIFTDTDGMFIPMGVGARIRVTDGVSIDLGYRMNFARSYGFDGVTSDQRDVFSYSHIGLEFALGNRSKPTLANANPVLDLYDDLIARLADQNTTLQSTVNEMHDHAAELKHENERMQRQIERLYADLADDDKDGVPNRYDKCPDTPIGYKVDGSGCPLPDAPAPIIQQITITEEDRRVVDEAIQNLEFDLGKATIRPSSYPSLNKVAILLIEKNFSLKLAGHTDNSGSMQFNLKLSKDRAEAVKSYLVSKGANPSRIEATGYGPTQPIASNATEAGRQQNRRVEFTLF